MDQSGNELHNAYDGNAGTKWVSTNVGTVKFELESEDELFNIEEVDFHQNNEEKL